MTSFFLPRETKTLAAFEALTSEPPARGATSRRAIAPLRSALDSLAMLVQRPIPRYQCLPHLYLAGFMLLVAASMLVASIPGALATDSDDRGPSSRAKILALYIPDYRQAKRRPVLIKPVMDLFCIDRANAPLGTASLPSLSCLGHGAESRPSNEKPNCTRDILKHCVEDQIAEFFGIGVVGQQRPKFYADGLTTFVLISTFASVGIHTFTSSDGTKITYTMIMPFNASRDTFGPQVHMDADNRALMCAISSRDTQTISRFRQSLADAFVEEAADPGRGHPRVAIERSFADDLAAEATNGIMSRCLLGKNGGGAPIMIAAHDQGLNFY